MDCEAPASEELFSMGEFEKFLSDKIKVDGKAGNLGTKVTLSVDKFKMLITAELPFSKRYLKYLSKKFLQKESLRAYLQVHASSKGGYLIKYMKSGAAAEEED